MCNYCSKCWEQQQPNFNPIERQMEYEKLKSFFENGKSWWIKFMSQNLPAIRQHINKIDDCSHKKPKTAKQAENNLRLQEEVLNSLYTYFARFHI